MTSRATEPTARVLVVDDNMATAELLQRQIAGAGFEVELAFSVHEAGEVLDRKPIDLVVTDFRMPGATGLDLVRHLRDHRPDVAAMVITGYASLQGAVEAVKVGAEEYLGKPFTEDELLGALRRTLEKLRLRRAARRPAPVGPPHGLLGESPAMAPVRSAVSRAAASSATVLVAGESGTGKELVARAIHYGGERRSAPFVAVNCAGIPEALVESELFGHVKGAFTGASTSRAGFLLTADRGTVFLDEVAEMSLATQAKVLRFLQERDVYMVGSSHPRHVDVRVIAASNKNLEQLVARKLFRHDLFYRLNVLPIALPPLRARGDDVLLLARHFASKFAGEQGREPPRFSDAALIALRAYDWPGNVRELENAMQRVLVMGDVDVIDVSDLPPALRFPLPREAPDVLRPLVAVEAEHVQRVLAAVGGNRTQAARILGIDRKTLRTKLAALDLPLDDELPPG